MSRFVVEVECSPTANFHTHYHTHTHTHSLSPPFSSPPPPTSSVDTYQSQHSLIHMLFRPTCQHLDPTAHTRLASTRSLQQRHGARCMHASSSLVLLSRFPQHGTIWVCLCSFSALRRRTALSLSSHSFPPYSFDTSAQRFSSPSPSPSPRKTGYPIPRTLISAARQLSCSTRKLSHRHLTHCQLST